MTNLDKTRTDPCRGCRPYVGLTVLRDGPIAKFRHPGEGRDLPRPDICDQCGLGRIPACAGMTFIASRPNRFPSRTGRDFNFESLY